MFGYIMTFAAGTLLGGIAMAIFSIIGAIGDAQDDEADR